jgi:phosphoribosyl 1,2-cyclic phosphate phosphodiesterase
METPAQCTPRKKAGARNLNRKNARRLTSTPESQYKHGVKVTLLGTGTSHGIPVVGCTCAVCRSENPRNSRMRCSVHLQTESTSVIIDTTPEFRLQALRAGLNRLDAVVLTHAHADHIHGLDDIRPFSYHAPIPLYGSRPTLEEIRERFSYIFRTTQKGGGKPRIEPIAVDASPFRVRDLTFTPLPVLHGNLRILGYRVGPFAYITDCSKMPEETLQLLEGVEVLVLNALRYTPHPTHLSIDEALSLIEVIKPRAGYLTHLCHDIDHEMLAQDLTRRHARGETSVLVEPAYDGLVLDVPGATGR